MRDGWIKLHRQIQDNPLWKEKREFSKAEAWLDILMEVRYQEEPCKVIIKNKVLLCNQGECLYSCGSWAKRWGWSISKVMRVFDLFKMLKIIETKDEVVTTRLIVLNYKEYGDDRIANEQQSEQQSINNRLTIGDNRRKKENKEILVSSSSVASEKIFENLVLAQATKGKNEQNKQALATQSPETKTKTETLTTQSPDKGDNTAKNQNQTSEIIKFSDQAKTGNLATQTQKDQNKNTPPVPPTPPMATTSQSIPPMATTSPTNPVSSSQPSPIAQAVLDYLDERSMFLGLTHFDCLREWERDHGAENMLKAFREAELKFKLRDFKYIAGILRIQQERGYPWGSEQQTKPIIKPMQAKQANYSEDDSEASTEANYIEQNYSKQAIKPKYSKQAGNSEVSASVQIIAMQKMEETRQKIMFDLMDFKGMGLPYEKQKSEIWKRYRVDLDTAQIY